MDSYDAVIIGAGVVGCSIALSLSRAGFTTLNVDALPAPGYGSTSHSSAIVRPFYSHLTSCAIAHEARSRWQRWPDWLAVEDPSGYASYAETGGTILVTEGDESMFEQNLSLLSAVGVAYEWLDSTALTQRFPHMSLASFGPPKVMQDEQFGVAGQKRISGGIYIPACGHVSDPQLATHNLFCAAKHQGAEFSFDREVVDIKQADGHVHAVRLNDGQQIACGVLVNAAGPHSAKVNTLAGAAAQMPIKTAPHRHEVAYLQKPAEHAAEPGFLVDVDTGMYQRSDGADLLIGSADPVCDQPDVVDPDAYNTSFTEQWTLQVYRAALRFPELGIESKARGTVGLYDVSDDWIPIYDKTDLGGYYVAIGTSGNQFKNAPLIGDIMTAIVTAESRGINHDVEPQRLDLSAVGRSVDLSFYSRHREIQSTASVMA